MATGLSVAKAIVEIAQEKSLPSVTNLSLQRLAYSCHGWCLALTGEPLIDEIKNPFEAWDYGPVMPSLYRQFKYHSSNPLPSTLPIFKLGKPLKPRQREIVEEVMTVFGRATAAQLIGWPRAQDGPWDPVYHSQTSTDPEIDDANIEEYFKSLSERIEECFKPLGEKQDNRVDAVKAPQHTALPILTFGRVLRHSVANLFIRILGGI